MNQRVKDSASGEGLAILPGRNDRNCTAIRHLAVVQCKQRRTGLNEGMGHWGLGYRVAYECGATRLHSRDIDVRAKRIGGQIPGEQDLLLQCCAGSDVQCMFCDLLPWIVQRGDLSVPGGLVPGRNLSDWHEAGGELGAAKDGVSTRLPGGDAYARYGACRRVCGSSEPVGIGEP